MTQLKEKRLQQASFLGIAERRQGQQSQYKMRINELASEEKD